ncbi:TCB2 [Enterospora canceri]|uniref:TCB2 n=1 Tax=Enterospora canceri TaxID=1081671 RepID=A0A1Y1S766_9MICR|nr:TCB2 [Enterospora canceri]
MKEERETKDSFVDDTGENRMKIRPQDVPDGVAERKPKRFKGIPSLRTITNPLDLSPTNPILRMLKVPGIIFCSTIGGYLVGKLGARPFYLVLIGHCIYAFYRRRVSQYQLSVDTIMGQAERLKSMGEHESVEWMNYVVRRAWLNVEAAVSSEIHSAVNKVLKANCPKFLKSIKLSEITLGTEPPVVERVKFVDEREDVVVLEASVAFVPLQDEAVFTEPRSHWNTCIQLSVALNNLISLPILVRNFTFSATMHVELSLLKKAPFVDKLRFQFTELPVIDFVFIPLKICDFMDLPLLSSTLKSTANRQLSAILVAPHFLEVDLSKVDKYAGKRIGVICVRLESLLSADDGIKSVTLSIDGTVFGETEKHEGRNPKFNEVFYALVKDTNTTISLRHHQEADQFGVIHLRNLNKHSYSENINMCNGHGQSLLGATTLFYQATESKKESAILSIKVVGVDNLHKRGMSKKLLYNTYVIVRVVQQSTKRTIAEFETKRIFASRSPQFNEKFEHFVRDFDLYDLAVKVVDDKDDSQIGDLYVPLSDIHDCSTGTSSRFRLRGVENGEILFEFGMEYIDIHDSRNVSLKSEDESEAINSEVDESRASRKGVNGMNMSTETEISRHQTRVEEPGAPPPPDPTEFHPLKLPEPVGLDLGIYNLKKQSKRLIDFKYAVQVTSVSFSSRGSFYFVFETNSMVQKTQQFTTVIGSRVSSLLPISNERVVLVRLFKITVNGDSLIGEEFVDISGSCFVCVFDRTRVEFAISKTALVRNHNKKHSTKFVQIRFNSFDNLIESLHFYDGRSLVYASEIFRRFLFKMEGGTNLRVKHLKTVEIGKTEMENEEVDLGNFRRSSGSSELLAHADLVTVGCDVPFVKDMLRGVLEIHVINATGVEPPSSATANPFVVVYVNKESVFKTAVKRGTRSPEFNESVDVEVVKEIDRLGLTIYEHNRIAANEILTFCEFPLYNLVPGYSKHELAMKDAHSGAETKTVLTVLFNYKRSRK